VVEYSLSFRIAAGRQLIIRGFAGSLSINQHLPFIGDNANYEHLPGHVFRDARHQKGIASSVPSWGRIDPDVAAILPFVDALTADKGPITRPKHRVVVPVTASRFCYSP
jgi:hypothetical protein